MNGKIIRMGSAVFCEEGCWDSIVMAPREDMGLPSNCLVAYDLGLTFAFLFYFKKMKNLGICTF